jgi:hypothetical protein
MTSTKKIIVGLAVLAGTALSLAIFIAVTPGDVPVSHRVALILGSLVAGGIASRL